MTCGDLQHLWLDPEWTEENGHGACIPDGVKQPFAALGMITVDYHCIERFALDGIFDRLFPFQEPRLRTTKLYHQAQQRRDDFLAREIRHIAQCHQPKRDAASRQLTDLQHFSGAPPAPARYFPGNKCPPSATGESVGNLFAHKRPVSSLSESTMKELRSALTEQLKRPDGPTPELASLLKRIGREAHDNGVQPEKLIVIFKQLWNSLAESLRPQNADQYERVRQRLVTLCIQAYYAE